MRKYLLLFLLWPCILFAAAPSETPVEPTILNDAGTAVGVRNVTPIPRTNTTNITECGTLSSADTIYVLQNNVSAPASCFAITASRVTLDLNGKTLTWGTADCSGSVTCAYGIRTDDYNLTDIQIVNGTITEGAGVKVPTYHESTYGANTFYGVTDATTVELAGLNITYHSSDMSGIFAIYTHGLSVHDCTITDAGTEVTSLPARSSGLAAIKNGGANSPATIYYNKIVNYRQRGMEVPKGSSVYNNNMTGLSACTNSFGINTAGEASCGSYPTTNVYNNKIVSRGVHPFGMWVGCNVNIHDNYIDLQSTAEWIEGYSSAGGMRATWESHTGVNIYNNTVLVQTSAGKKALGLLFGTYTADDVVNIYENLIIATSNDGTTRATAVSFEANGCNDGETLNGCPHAGAEHIKVDFNTLKSNYNIVTIGGEYGGTLGYPLFSNNSIVKFGANAAFKTITDYGYGSLDSTLILCSNNTYSGGAAADDYTLTTATGSAVKEILTSSVLCSDVPPEEGGTPSTIKVLPGGMEPRVAPGGAGIRIP